MDEPTVVISLSAIVGSICLIWRSKRRFSRLNQFGIEQFPSYTTKIFAISLETLLLGFGYGLLGAAALVFAVTYAQPFLSLLCLLGVIWMIEASQPKSRR